MQIPLVDLTQNSQYEKKKILKTIQRILKKGSYILGPELEAFEKNFASYIGVSYCIGVASGSDALLLSLKALGIGPGDEVIVPAMTFTATASAVIHAGARPVFVDVLKGLPLLDCSQVEEKVTPYTKAIIPVHMHGHIGDMDTIKKIAKKYKLFVIEDACQAHGSYYNNNKAGSLGDVAAFSFYPSKNLGAYGDAGAITTSSKRLYEKIKMLRHHGQKKKSLHKVLGYNSRMDTLQAAVLNVKLHILDKNNRKRRANAALYNKLLKDVPVKVYQESGFEKANYYVYAIEAEKRDLLLGFLKSKKIYSDIHYSTPLHLQPAFSDLGYKKGDFPNAEFFAKHTLSLPMFPELTVKQINYICNEIKRFYLLNGHQSSTLSSKMIKNKQISVDEKSSV